MDARQPDGATLREHFSRAAAHGIDDPMLDDCRPPRFGAELWSAFAEISGSRPQGMGGACGIPLTEIEAWCRLYNVSLSPWEIGTIKAMDAAVVSVWSEQRDKT